MTRSSQLGRGVRRAVLLVAIGALILTGVRELAAGLPARRHRPAGERWAGPIEQARRAALEARTSAQRASDLAASSPGVNPFAGGPNRRADWPGSARTADASAEAHEVMARQLEARP
jgi:hypothetical protein